ncbi:MAG: hypothetical protein QW372_01285 [Nitrososphaerales archaeon]
MKINKIFIGLICISLLALFLLNLPSIMAQPAGPYITDWRIEDPNRIDVTNKTLIAGGTYTIYFKVVIRAAPPGVNLSLETPLVKVGDVYWRLYNNYSGINTTKWQPGRSILIFKAVEGVADLSLIGKIPDNYTISKIAPSYELHFEKSFPIVILRYVSGAELDRKEVRVTDKTIIQYSNLVMEKSKLVNTTITDPNFAALYNSIINLAKKYSSIGDVNRAIEILELLPKREGFPPPREDTSIYLYGIGGLGGIVVILAILLMRSRSYSSFILREVDEQVRQLDTLLIRLTRIDKSLAGEVNNIKEKLQKIGRG